MLFGFNVDKFANKEYRVLFAGLYLQEPTFECFNNFLQDFLNNDLKDRDDVTKVITHNFSCFKKQMQQVFEDFDKEHTAECKMQVLWKTGSAAEYTSKFQQYALQT